MNVTAGAPPSRVGVAWKAARSRRNASEGELFASGADQAALEWALGLAQAWGAEVTVVCAGPLGVEAVLRQALASGAHHAVRVESGAGASQSAVAVALAQASATLGLQWWCCGERGLHRSSGAVPALLAAALRWPVALGVLSGLEGVGSGHLEVVRRLERGRRERLALRAPTVISVEAESASLRRASLPSLLAAQDVPIPVLAAGATGGEDPRVRVLGRRAHRPPTRSIPAPLGADARSRVADLTGVYAARSSGRRQLETPPAAAAAAIIEALQAWGYVDGEDQPAGRGRRTS